jgi:hypothetical protein
MYSYDTLSEAITDLQKRGYKGNLNLKNDVLACADTGLQLSPEEFHIDEVYRFEGETDPGDELILYAIGSEKYQYKGILVNAFGIYAEEPSSHLIAKLSTR